MEVSLKHLSQKILDQSALPAAIARWSLLNKKVVFTNGCFDLIHPGHIHTLSAAKAFGDVLIVGLNSDASVRRLKGEGRPVKNEESRALLLVALTMVDAVVIFEDDTPLELIKLVQPDVLVKGGDYEEEKIVGYKEMNSWNGKVEIVPFLDGHSSTSLINKT